MASMCGHVLLMTCVVSYDEYVLTVLLTYISIYEYLRGMLPQFVLERDKQIVIYAR